MWWIVGVVAAVALVATYLTWLASRVDRLHDRAGAAQAALEAHLDRRHAIAAGLAGALERPGLAEAARAAAAAGPDDREAAENDLTRQLRALPFPADSPVLAEVTVASRRVALARQVHNDLTRDALAMRRRPLVRLLRLATRHPAPRYFDVDDPILGPPGAAQPPDSPPGAAARGEESEPARVSGAAGAVGQPAPAGATGPVGRPATNRAAGPVPGGAAEGTAGAAEATRG